MADVKRAADAADDDDEPLEGGMSDDGGGSIGDFLAQFSMGSQFILNRLEPKNWTAGGKTRKVSGHLETYHAAPTLDAIRDDWGGGVYEIRVTAPRGGAGGTRRFAGSRRFEIAGDPRMKGDVVPDESPAAPQAAATDPTIMRVVEETIQDRRLAEERLDRVRSQLIEAQGRGGAARGGEQQLAMLQQSIETLRQQLDKRDNELAELRQQLAKKSESSVSSDRDFLKVVLGRASEDVTATHAAHRQEIQGERDRHAREMEAERDRHRRELDAQRERHAAEVTAMRREYEQQSQVIERLHRSELESLRAGHANQLEALKMGQSQFEGLRNDAHARLLAENNRLQEEVRSLREQVKPQDPVEQAKSFAVLAQTVQEVVGGGPPKAEASMVERLAERAAAGLLGRLGGAASTGATQPAAPVGAMQPRRVPQSPPQAQQTRQPGRPQATVRPAQPAQSAQPAQPMRPPVREPRSSQATSPRSAPQSEATTGNAGEHAAPPAPPEPREVPAMAPLSPELLQALEFVEGAMRQSQPAAELAQAAISMLPRSELAALVAHGADTVADQIKAQKPASTLATMGGRRYIRELFAALDGALAA